MKPEPKSIFTPQRALFNPLPIPASQPSRRTSIIAGQVNLVHTAGALVEGGPLEIQHQTEHNSGDTNEQWETGGQTVESAKKAGVDGSELPPTNYIGQDDVPAGRHMRSPGPVLKRSREAPHDFLPDISEAPQKKRRTRPSLRHTIDPATFPSGLATTGPPSPLFFSNSHRERPSLPPRLSGSQTAATMLSKSRDENSVSSVTTLKLARGSISHASPPRAMSTPGSWVSHRRTGSTPMSPKSTIDSEAQQVLSGFGIVEFLEQDERPTFIIDLSNAANFTPGPLQLLYANASLRAYDTVLEMVLGKADLDSPGVVVTNTFPEFKAWLISFVKNNESMDVCLPSFLYGGVTWTCSTLKKRLRVVSGRSDSLPLPIAGSGSGSGSASTPASVVLLGVGNQRRTKPVRSPLQEATEAPDYFGDAVNKMERIDESGDNASQLLTESPAFDDAVVGSSPSNLDQIPSHLKQWQDRSLTVSPLLRRDSFSSFDWTRLPISPALPRHIQFARSIDWASTSLGPIENWSYDLRAMSNMVMGSPHPAAMYWGEEYVAIYNEAYIVIAGNKHPTLMGQSYKAAWAEIWEDQIEGAFREARESGQATMKDDDCLFIVRNGFLEETYFSWSIVPLVGEDGKIAGLYNPCFEKTRRKIAERRMLTLREVGEKVATAKDVAEFWGQVTKALEYNEFDVPFLYLYSVSDESDSDLSSMYSGSLATNPQVGLEGTLGIPENHPSRVSPLDLKTSNQTWAPFLREAMKNDTPVLLSMDDDSLSELISGVENRGFEESCRSAVVCPIYPTTGEGSSILGFFIMGINPRRPYDDDYSLFIQLLSRQLATSMASVVLFEEEIRRGQRAARLAALDRIELSKQLDLRTQEARESETKFTRMAEFAPVGMFIANSNGHVIYSNDTWFRLINSSDNWMASIMDEDRESANEMWTKVIKDKQPVTHEFRVKTPWQDQNGNHGDTWVLMSAYPEKHPDGGLKSVFGSLTEISSQKWAESYQKRRMEEAMEMKRQQENFIDMTSHEIRNPTSVILQCADEITSTLSEYAKTEGLSQRAIDILESSTDAAQTIALCSLHQKRIVDDILTLSKLDSALLLVTPVDVQPIAAIQGALNMFKGELESNDIALEFQIENSFIELRVDWVKLDPSRLLQVLINLITNAIKFTHSQEKRTITVSMGASTEPLSNALVPTVSYFPSRSKRDITQGEDWGTGEELFLFFAVQDTGQGLDDEEKKMLFNRFSQASPRTHVQYGGSGLGLFISRELTELQGGEIGVASERGVGSTFAFFIKSRRAQHPENASSSLSTRLSKNSSGKSVVSVIDKHKQAAGKHAKIKKDAQVLSDQENSSEIFQVLIVEDNLVNQRVLQKQLRNLKCVTRLANHGGEALDVLKKSNFWKGNEETGFDLTVVLMDLEMPVMDGLTCAKRIRELEVDGTIVRHVPIIAVTANARAEQIGMALSAGMDDVVSKPFRIPELMTKIEELVQRSTQEI